MAENQYVPIGFTKKTHGIAGELKIAVEPDYLEDFLRAETLFLEIRGKKVPYFVASVRSENLILKLEDVDTPEAAAAISSKPVFLRAKDILHDEERTIPVGASGYGFCKGFTMVEKTVGEVGKIVGIVEMPQSEMAVVEYRGKEVFVPLIKQFIQKVDKRGRRVLVDLPEGLLDM